MDFKGNIRIGIPRYEAAAEPNIPSNTEAIWWDTVLTQLWFIVDRGGVQYKVQLG